MRKHRTVRACLQLPRERAAFVGGLNFCCCDHAASDPQRQAQSPAATLRALNCKHFPQNGMIIASTPPPSNLHRRSTQKPLSRNMVELQPDAVRIFEQQRIISRRPLILARRANDRHTERTQKAVQFVNVGALAGAKTQMLQAAPVLLERSAA